MEGTSGVEGGNEETTICSPQEVHWAVMGARKDSVDKIAAVESVETFLTSMQDRFVARAIGDPRGVGDLLQRSGGGGELGETERELLEHATGTPVEGDIEWWVRA